MGGEEVDRRSDSRQNLNLLVEYPDRQGYKLDVTESVSPNGIFIRSAQHHKLGEKLQLSVSLPGFPDSVQLVGEVTRIREATQDIPRGVALRIDQAQYMDQLSKIMTPAASREFSLSSGPYSVLAAMPRVRLADTPTPLHRAERLSKALGGPEIWFKRDDLTGFALGGNKVRKLELIVGDALEKRADVLVTGAHVQQSSRIRVLAAVAAKLGMRSVAVIADYGEPDPGRLCYSDLCGCDARPLPSPHLSIDQNIEQCAEELRLAGHKPYIVTENDFNWRGAASYMLATIELVTQLRRLNLEPEVLVCPVGSAETMSGLVSAQRWLDCSYDVLGMSVKNSEHWCGERVATLCSELCSELNIADTIPVDDIWTNADYIGPGYGKPSAASMNAVRLVAKHEGIFLDPVFCGKAMAGVVDMIEKGEFTKGQTLIFLHTGAICQS